MRRLGTVVVTVIAAVGLLAAAASASFIVYGCGYNLCRVAPDGTGAKQITTNGTAPQPYHWPSLAVDGRRMSWLRGNDVMLGDANARSIAGPFARTAWFDVIRPDGTQVGVLVQSAVFYGLYAYIYDQSGKTLMSGPEPAIYSLGWAADGQHLLLPLYNHDSSGVGICVTVPNPIAGWDCGKRVAFTAGAYLSDPALSPDHRTLAVTVLPNRDASAGHIALYDYNSGGFIRSLTTGSTDALPVWSPDGSMVAFQRGTSIYTIQSTAAPGAERRLVSSGETPTWGGLADPAASALKLVSRQHGATIRARLTIRLTGSNLDARLLGIGSGLGGRLLGSLKITHASAGIRTLAISLSKAGRSALKRRHTLKLKLRVTVQPPIGRASLLSGTVTVRG